MTTELPWRALTGADLPAVAALAGRCLAQDGGLPLAADESFLGRRFAAPGGAAWGVPDGSGGLLAAGAVRIERTGAPSRPGRRRWRRGSSRSTRKPSGTGRAFRAGRSRSGWTGPPATTRFRPQWSLLAHQPGLGDVGFITCADGWVVQVGVRPDQRGRRLGAALVTAALGRIRADGGTTALLDVNVNNPAGELHQRLGFRVIGRRARFEPAGQRAG